jgi:hypothetical protein
MTGAAGGVEWKREGESNYKKRPKKKRNNFGTRRYNTEIN